MTSDSRNGELIARATAIRDQLARELTELIALASAIRDGLQASVEGPIEPTSNPLQIANATMAAHRRAHRPGHPAKIDCYPELEAFILARIESQTFDQITAAIKATFPLERRVGRSSLHRWWRLREAAENAPRSSQSAVLT